MSRDLIDSGIEWIGKIPNNWKLTKIDRLFILRNEKVNDSDYQPLSVTKSGVVPQLDFVAKSNAHDDRKLVKKGDFVINSRSDRRGSCGISNYDGSVSLINTVLTPISKELAFSSWIFYTTQFADEFYKYGHGIVDDLWTTGWQEMRKIVLPIPPKEEQLRISSFIEKKCSEIESIKRMLKEQIETLNQYKESLISEVVTCGLKKDVVFKDSGAEWLKKIPSSWQYTNPKALFSLRNQKADEGEKQLTSSQEYGIIYQDEYMELTGNKVVIVAKDFDILKHVEPGDFVISMRSFQGGLEYSEKSGSISSAYVMLIPNLQLVYPPFYKWFFKCVKYINAIQSTSNLIRDGQAMRYSNFTQIPLFIIPMDEQIEMANFLNNKCSKIDVLIRARKNQLERIEEYKKSFIFEYVTGKKEVPNEQNIK